MAAIEKAAAASRGAHTVIGSSIVIDGEITGEAAAFVREIDAGDGVLLIYLRHTSASLVIQENADPDVRTDLENFFKRLVPDGDPLFLHTCEGADDMPAHVRTEGTRSPSSRVPAWIRSRSCAATRSRSTGRGRTRSRRRSP